MVKSLRVDLGIAVTNGRNGNLIVTLLNENDEMLEIEATPLNLQRMCMKILAHCEQATACHYIPTVGHA